MPLPAESSSQPHRFCSLVCLFLVGSHNVVQVGLELLESSNPLVSASQVAGNTDADQHAQLDS